MILLLLKPVERFRLPIAGVRPTFLVTPWSQPAAEQRCGGRNHMIQSDLQSCLAECSKSSECLIKDGTESSSRYKSPSLASHISKNKFKGVNSSPAMPLQPHRYCLLPRLNADRMGPYGLICHNTSQSGVSKGGMV